jgi:hypothetical protein
MIITVNYLIYTQNNANGADVESISVRNIEVSLLY